MYVSKHILIRSRAALFIKCCLLFLFVSKTNAQVNYVLNPSLEIYDTCPFGPDQISYAKYWSSLDSVDPWFDPPPSGGRPEYINICDTDPNTEGSAPSNGFYFHYPRTGN